MDQCNRMAPANQKDKEMEGAAMEVTSGGAEKAVESKEAKSKGKNGKNGKKDPEELSEEDTALKDGLELAVTRLQEKDTDLHKQALDHLINEIRTATSSMTSVPKPLKFLRPHYDTLKGVYESWAASHALKTNFADMMSVLAMTMQEKGSFECLKFKLQGSQVNISSWGHEYVRYLSGEISEEYNKRQIEEAELTEGDNDTEDLMGLVGDIVPFQMSHNAEAEAADLLLEVQQLKMLVESDPPVVDERNYERVCLYLLRSADFMGDPDDLYNIFTTCFAIYLGRDKFLDALRVALKMDDKERITEVFTAVDVAEKAGKFAPKAAEDGSSSGSTLNSAINWKKQMCLLLGRHRSSFELEEEQDATFTVNTPGGSEEITLNELIGNSGLSERFLAVARDMGVNEPKTAETIYKQKGEGGPSSRRSNNSGSVVADSARANLATSFVNGFVNAGHCKDALMTEDGNAWVARNKDHGMLSATASLGMVMLWNVDEGLNAYDPFLHHPSEPYVRAGALLGIGLMSSGVRNESDAAMAVLSEYMEDPNAQIRQAVLSGLGIAYAGARKEELEELLLPQVENADVPIAEASFAALSLGLSFVGTCNDDVATTILQRIMESSDDDLNHTCTRFMCLGLALLYLGKAERAEVTLEAVRCIEHARGKYAEIALQTCAYAGTGNVLQVQQMLKLCAERFPEETNTEHQAVAVLGIALVTLGEDVGREMALRTFEHLLHYGEIRVRRMVPLALALLYVSNPDYGIVDQLSRLSHDPDAQMAQSAILGLGLVSAGSNNSRVAGLLRGLCEYHAKEAAHLFVVRIAQGLNAAAKGLTSLAPFHSDRLLMNGSAVAGILTVLHACVDIKGTLLDKYHYILYYLAAATNPRYLSTVDADLQLQSISVRVGLAVETVGQAGRPKAITGFQTHTSPVLVGVRERAELANQEYITLGSVLEGCVIIEKAPEDQDDDAK